jgi:trk system potassium uptake protein TrkA
MRIVFVGASALTLMAVRMIAARGHEVIVIESDETRLKALGDDVDCGRIHGDGTRPLVLKEADPAGTDFLFCLTGSDQANIIGSLVGRTLGFRRVITRIDDPDFEHICVELGLEDTIIPARTIGRFLTDMVEGRDPLELSAMVKDDAAVFSFVARDEDAGAIGDLELPADTRVACTYRDGRFQPVTDDSKIKAGDEILVITRRSLLAELRDRQAGGSRAPA